MPRDELGKFLTVAQLATVLRDLKPADRLIPNAVGNLLIVRDGQAVGFVDFIYEGGIEWFDASHASSPRG